MALNSNERKVLEDAIARVNQVNDALGGPQISISDFHQDDDNRKDVVENLCVKQPPATSEQAAFEHTYGVLTPVPPTPEKTLSPEPVPAEQVLTPRDAVAEDGRLALAQRLGEAQAALDNEIIAKQTTAARRGFKEIDPKKAAAEDDAHDERIAAAARRIVELEAEATKPEPVERPVPPADDPKAKPKKASKPKAKSFPDGTGQDEKKPKKTAAKKPAKTAAKKPAATGRKRARG